MSPAASFTAAALANFEAGNSSWPLAGHDIVGSMGRVGAVGDNAAMESFFSLLPDFYHSGGFSQAVGR